MSEKTEGTSVFFCWELSDLSPDTQSDMPTATPEALTLSAAVDPVPSPTAETIVYKLRSGYDLQFKLEVTAGDVLISTLLAFLIITILVMFFHKLILGGRD
jgi:hypothetical protein